MSLVDCYYILNNSKKESKKIQNILFSLGFVWSEGQDYPIDIPDIYSHIFFHLKKWKILYGDLQDVESEEKVSLRKLKSKSFQFKIKKLRLIKSLN